MEQKKILDFVDSSIENNYHFNRDQLLRFNPDELMELFSLMMLKVESREGELTGLIDNLEDIVAEQTQELRRKNEELEKLAIYDGLTKLYNRRVFDQKLEEYAELSRRIKNPLACIMQDIDHFKKVNDTYGHKTGDDVLRVIAGILKNNFRKTDVCARYGGEEFVALLPDTSVMKAVIIANKVRGVVESSKIISDNKVIKVTSSFGVAGVTNTSTTGIQMVKSADKALYRSKKLGRNRVCFFMDDKIVKTER